MTASPSSRHRGRGEASRPDGRRGAGDDVLSAPPGGLRAISISHSKSVSCGALLWPRGHVKTLSDDSGIGQLRAPRAGRSSNRPSVRAPARRVCRGASARVLSPAPTTSLLPEPQSMRSWKLRTLLSTNVSCRRLDCGRKSGRTTGWRLAKGGAVIFTGPCIFY
jgi:hypothetical protein